MLLVVADVILLLIWVPKPALSGSWRSQDPSEEAFITRRGSCKRFAQCRILAYGGHLHVSCTTQWRLERTGFEADSAWLGI